MPFFRHVLTRGGYAFVARSRGLQNGAHLSDIFGARNSRSLDVVADTKTAHPPCGTVELACGSEGLNPRSFNGFKRLRLQTECDERFIWRPR